MSNITAVILSFLQLALRLLDTVDKAAADDFRRSVALDASGVLVSKLGGKNTDTVYAHTGEHPKMDDRDAATLAEWIYDVEQSGR